MTMTLVETITVGSGGAASIEFTGIPGEGKDLRILVSARGVGSANGSLRINNDSGTKYSYVELEGTGSGPPESTSGTGSTQFPITWGSDGDYTANTFGSVAFYVSNYTSTADKSSSAEAVQENDATYAKLRLHAGLYETSSAVTSIKLLMNSYFVEHSTASLYIIS